MFLAEMHFYWWKKKGTICVQNMVAGLEGQYHEHTPEAFERWKTGIEEKYLHKLDRKGGEENETLDFSRGYKRNHK